MSIKTAYSYNEDDFAQHGENLDELTVTITLCEYRNLISDQARSEMTIDRLQEEKAELEAKLKSVSEALAACKLPEWVRNIGNTLAHWGEDQEDNDETIDDQEQ